MVPLVFGTVTVRRGFACMLAAPLWIPYCGPGPTPAELPWRWNFDPLLLVALGAAATAYVLWRRRGGSGRDLTAGVGLALLVVVFVSPLCALSSALFSARVFHHAVLAALVAPLLVRSVPPLARLSPPLAIGVLVHAITFWVWHSPALYAAALSSDAIYWVMQATLLGSAIAFWGAVRRAPPPAAALGLLATLVQTGLLGALITFAAAPLYAPHLGTTVAWGLTPLEDQQLAGLIMWAPMAGVYLLAALVVVARGLARQSEAKAAGC